MNYIKSFLNQHPLLKKIVLRPYLYAWHVYAVMITTNKFRKYNKKYFSKYDKKWIQNNYVGLPGMNIWFLLEQNHSNIGDLAIGVADKEIFQNLFPNANFHFVYEYLYDKNKKHFRKVIKRDDIIVLIGGGSIGNYQSHEHLREDIISKFRDNTVISMPQTMCFSEDKAGRRDLRKAVRAYSSNHNLYLMAREKYTYNEMKKFFSGTKVVLSPDVVMSLERVDPKSERNGIILCFRNDMEKKLTKEQVEYIQNISQQLSDNVKYSDMTAVNEFIPLEEREKVVAQKIDEFTKAKLVVTDRLHGMIFCAISGTPCIAFANYNTKIIGCYEWISNLKYIQFCDSVEKYEKVAKSLLCLDNNQYDASYTKHYFEDIRKYINQRVEIKEANR